MEHLTAPMDVLTREDLKSLALHADGPCVSLFIPTHRAGAAIQQDPIRLKNGLRGAHDMLAARGMRDPEINAMLKDAFAMVDDTLYWRYQCDGLAMFIAPGMLRVFRLPIAFEEQTMVNDRFRLAPLLPLFAGDGRFFVLAVSQGRLRLLEGSRFSVAEITPDSLPKSLAEFLRFDEFEDQLQLHSHTAQSGGRPGAGPRAAIYHGHGGGDYDKYGPKEQLLQYFKQVDSVLQPMLHNEQAPLVFAGVQYLFPIYQEANSFHMLMPEPIQGNPDDLKPEELHAKAWHVVAPYYATEIHKASAQFQNLQGTGRTSQDIEEVLGAAVSGRVGALFIDPKATIWGTYDNATQQVTRVPTAEEAGEELIDLAAMQTILNGGAVYAGSTSALPGNPPVAAVFRY